MLLPEGDIHRAFEQDEFFPCFQPLVELRTCQIAGFEVLARWNHGKLGAIPPDVFIPQIERHGLINQLTQSMLEKAFAASPLLPAHMTLAINLSPMQLLDAGLPKKLEAASAKSGFSLKRLTLEITESALVDDLPLAMSVARDLKSLGCRLALDDFGTGYSSLKHLNALPFDELKVDRSFIGSMTEKRDSRKIVAAVLGLGQSLGLMTAAEGVETQEQANMLFWLGCDIGQGWLYGRPAPAEDLPRIISEAQFNNSFAIVSPFDHDPGISLEAMPTQRFAQLQAIYDGAPVGLCFLDRKMRYVSLNKRLAELNGVPATAHIGRTVAEVIPHVAPVVEPFIQRALAGDAVDGVEFQRSVLVGGEEDRSLMASYHPVRDEAGEVVGVSVALMDISEFKRAEAALRESVSHYRHMVELSPHVPWVLDAKGEVTEASPRWENLTGQSLDDALGNGWLKVLHPDDVEPTREAIRNTLRNGDPIDVQYRVRRPGGEWIWLRSRGAPRFSPSDELVCIYGVVEEIHEQKQFSDELELCHIELRAAVNAVPEGILLVDSRDGCIFMVNAAATEIFGTVVFPGQKLSEYTRLPITGPDGKSLRPNQFAIVRAALQGESTDEMHVSFQKSGAVRIPLSVTGKPIHSHDGQLIGGLVMIRRLAAEA
ncbi:MAG: EAL domain-containing protein [Terracidiphilus sp.]|jgi:PAS domain S-box-containing protein